LGHPVHPDGRRAELRRGDGGGGARGGRLRLLQLPMNLLTQNLLTLVIFLPLLFAALAALLPAGERGQIRAVALVGMLVDLALGVALYLSFDSKGPELQLETRLRWLDELGISFHLGVDGLAVSL